MVNRIPASRGDCKTCGATIWWAQKPGGGWYRPLDAVESTSLGFYTVDSDGTARLLDTPLYKPHVCDQAAIKAHEEKKAEFEATHVDGTWHEAHHVKVPCPRCGAQVDELCRALDVKYAAKHGTHLRSPHAARVKLAEKT